MGYREASVLNWTPTSCSTTPARSATTRNRRFTATSARQAQRKAQQPESDAGGRRLRGPAGRRITAAACARTGPRDGATTCQPPGNAVAAGAERPAGGGHGRLTTSLKTSPRHGATAAICGWVNVIYGCNERCTYCVVPSVRGKEQSRLPQAIKTGDGGAGRPGLQGNHAPRAEHRRLRPGSARHHTGRAPAAHPHRSAPSRP